MKYQKTYTNYKRPPLSPPPYIFGVVWPILYILIIISYGFVFWQVLRGNITLSLAIPFVINLIANGLFTYFQFKLKNNLLATLDIMIILFTIIFTMFVIWPYYHWVTYIQIPYLVWVWFKSNFPDEILNLEVNQDNFRAIRCYEKSGFEKIGEKKYKNNKPTFVMANKNHCS